MSSTSKNGQLFVGLMSGTSCDGVDASLVETDALGHFAVLDNLHLPYNSDFQHRLKSLCSIEGRNHLLEVEFEMTNYHVEATKQLIEKTGMKSEDIRAIGFHGQTISHNPDKHLTWQIGNPHQLAIETEIDVVHDFRRRDIALGGQGAPLVPIFHKLIVAHEPEMPIAVLNIGGVANVTYIDGDRLIAFDTGPGNALIDDVCSRHFNLSFDAEGNLAAQGQIHQRIVDSFLSNEYFLRSYPKSLDRNHFDYILDELGKMCQSREDQIATVTHLSAISIVAGLKSLPKMPHKVLICGGGVHNLQLKKWIAEALEKEQLPVELSGIGNNRLDPDFIESQAFAYLAARFLRNLPSAFPETTGCRIANICGCLVEPGIR